MKKLEDCKEPGTQKRFWKSESGKTFAIELQSNDHFYCEIVDIDNCLFKDARFSKCDWLFLVPKGKGINEQVNVAKQKAYYVELKGGEIFHACEQLFNTIDKTKVDILNFDIEAIIVSTKGRQPEIANNKYYKKVKQVIRKEIQVCKVHKGNGFTHTERI